MCMLVALQNSWGLADLDWVWLGSFDSTVFQVAYILAMGLAQVFMCIHFGAKAKGAARIQDLFF